MKLLHINKNVQKINKLTAKQADQMKEHNKSLCPLVITTVLCLVALVPVAFIFKFHSPPENFCHIFIQTQGSVNIVSPLFLSLGLDSSVITTGFQHFNMTDPKLIKMMKYLSPAYLRIGGNAADQLIFCDQNYSGHCVFDEPDTSVLLGSDWLKLYHLATSAKLRIIYDLNSLLRYENGSWNSKNAIEMFEFSHRNGLMVDWELGNEPNSYEHKFNTRVNATQLGIDYITLRNILDEYELYKSSSLVGPSTTRLRTKDIEKYLGEFLISGSQAISAITWHHYYFSGINATPREFLDPDVFDYLFHCITRVNNVIQDLHLDLLQPIWLGETASAWHGGAENLSDRFIAGFIWIDKLGLSAQMGIDVVVRQSIFGGHYALLNDSYYPNPDWWLSIIYKKLVDPRVIGMKYIGYHDRKIRLYVHCAKRNSLLDLDDHSFSSSIVVFGVNINNETGFVETENLISDSKVYVYEITSESSLFSQYIRLNGKIINLLPNLDLPDLKPKVIVKGKVLSMPPYSIVFWVFTSTNVVPCLQ